MTGLPSTRRESSNLLPLLLLLIRAITWMELGARTRWLVVRASVQGNTLAPSHDGRRLGLKARVLSSAADDDLPRPFWGACVQMHA
jgi:hypothetical protein